MLHTLEEIRESAMELPEDQRIQLANSLLDSVDEDKQETSNELESEWASELQRRLHEIDMGNARFRPSEEVIARMDAKIAARQRG